VLQCAETIGLDGEPQFPFFANGTFRQSQFPEPLELLLSPPAAVSGNDAGTARLRVMFRTPTELKDHGQLVDEPASRVLFARIFDRLVSLASFYGKGTVPEDVALAVRGRLLSEAERLVIVKQELARVGADRLSRRTGRRHSLEGFAGHVEYTGPRETTEALLPWLQAGGLVGVGRQTVWGKGEIRASWPAVNGRDDGSHQ
jgi:CRISPR/Cas system endoribonuclease Cas6 (RAMP superfamily)